MSGSHRIFTIENSSQAYPVREVANEMGRDLGFNDTKIGAINIVINELAHNLVKHAQIGSMLVAPITSAQSMRSNAVIGLEIISIDRANGMLDMGHSMKDGVSTSISKSMGTGLGAIKRLSDKLEWFSLPGAGTAIVSQFFKDKERSSLNFDIGAISIALPSEIVCGDGFYVIERGSMLYVLVVDGLGHGVDAGKAADIALETFNMSKLSSPVDLINEMHGALRHSRGAALSVAVINSSNSELTFCGVGNVTGFISLQDSKKIRLVPSPGTAGYEYRKLKDWTYPWSQDSVLILHTDGLSTKLDLLENLKQKSSTTIAAILLRDYWRGMDDGTVLAIKAEKQN